MSFKFMIAFVIFIQLVMAFENVKHRSERRAETSDAEKLHISESHNERSASEKYMRASFLESTHAACTNDSKCAKSRLKCQLQGYHNIYCDSETHHCACTACDPCNCAAFCSDRRLNPLYSKGLTVGTCGCSSSTSGESECHSLISSCHCSSPPPQACVDKKPCYQTVEDTCSEEGYQEEKNDDVVIIR